MRTPLLLGLALVSLSSAFAQVIPGENSGDTGYLLHGTDTLALVRAADGHAWLQQNLGASEVATAANATNAYGHLYQWGRWEDGHQLRTSAVALATTLVSNDPSGLGAGSPLFFLGNDPLGWWSAGSPTDTWQGNAATAANGIDPCRALGPGWQLPAQADWNSLLAAEGITGIATAFASNVKLTAAGTRDGQTGTLINAGQFGGYWTSTASSIYAKDLTIGDSFVNPDDDALRSYGMSVRCLNKSLHVGLPEEDGRSLVALFPNPSHGTFSVQCTDPIVSVVVYNALSQLAATVGISGTFAHVVLPELQEGLYIVCVNTAKGSTREHLVIVR